MALNVEMHLPFEFNARELVAISHMHSDQRNSYIANILRQLLYGLSKCQLNTSRIIPGPIL